MFTKVDEKIGKITINPPLSKAGDKVILKAMMNVRVGIAAYLRGNVMIDIVLP